jgi:pseudouridine synthase
VSLARPPSEREIEELRAGVRLDDGLTAPAEVESWGERGLEITIREGRKRQVRRMAEAVGHRVEALTRIRIGPLELGDLRPGQARRLSPDEVDSLWQDARPMRTAAKKRSEG